MTLVRVEGDGRSTLTSNNTTQSSRFTSHTLITTSTMSDKETLLSMGFAAERIDCEHHPTTPFFASPACTDI